MNTFFALARQEASVFSAGDQEKMNQIIVAGSINLDIVARTLRQPRTGETVAGSDLRYNLGGKGANQAVAAARLNDKGRTVLLGRVGNDPFGAKLTSELAEFGLHTIVSVDPVEPTGTALITIAGGDNTIVVIPGANAGFAESDIDESIIGSGDICVSQLEIPVATVECFFRKARQRGAACILNAAPAPADSIRSLLQLTDCLVINETEAEAMTSIVIDASNADDVRRVAAELELTDQTLVVTLGADGCAALHNGTVSRIAGHRVDAVDTTGAGDCFIGALAASLLQQMPWPAALAFSNAAASICVGRPGAAHAMPLLSEVQRMLDS
ncbi:MAG TPA: ribokinase [Verrucomicrobiales bacterium]|nr:ribokinase [Verrucomicrobiales bacterium]